MSFKNIILESDEGCAIITINRPPYNILNLETLLELNTALEKVKNDDSIFVILIRSAGDRAFCTGLDVRDHFPDRINDALNAFNKIFYTLKEIDKPTIAVVRGYALGGGCELAIGCDMIIASEDAKFGLPEINVGSMPPVAQVLLPRMIGRKRAFELILTGDMISAAEAERIGLINKVVPTEKLDETAKEFVEKLKGKSPLVLKIARRAIYEAMEEGFEAALRRVTEIYLNSLIKTEDAVEGLKAFMEKRKPNWRGR